VIALSFGYFVGSSAYALLRHAGEFEITTARALRGVATELAILAVVAWILRARDWEWRRLTEPVSIASVIAGVPVALVTMMVAAGASVAVTAIRGAPLVSTVKMVPSAPAAVMLAFLIVNSFFEELTVSAYVIAALAPQGAAFSITASALLRFMYHLYQGPVASIWVLPLGLIFAAVYYRWRSVWPLIAAHTILNLLAFGSAR
jgi:membrane protease YdiL (CAAX protease family)